MAVDEDGRIKGVTWMSKTSGFWSQFWKTLLSNCGVVHIFFVSLVVFKCLLLSVCFCFVVSSPSFGGLFSNVLWAFMDSFKLDLRC